MWIWYPGDMELYHGMLQNFQREERGYDWPAFWKMDDWRKNVRFYRFYDLKEPEELTVHAAGVGHVLIDGVKYPFDMKISLEAGRRKIEIFVGNLRGLPSVYAESASGVIRTDRSWMADDFTEIHPAGTSPLFSDLKDDPNEVPYRKETLAPASVRDCNGGTLADFGRMVNGWPVIRRENAVSFNRLVILYGESAEEATDRRWCYYKEEDAEEGAALRRRAFRFLFLPDVRSEEVRISAVHTYIPMTVRAEFHSGDPLLNQIWATCAKTYLLCGGMFFIDGIKRDRWIWGGDACQSFAVNPYLIADKEINQRTLRALRGNTPVEQHINTIVDYSSLWLIAMEEEYRFDGDSGFLREMYPKMEALADLLMSTKNEDGFLIPRERDWIYIDWADMDKSGALCAEQILLWKALTSMSACARILAGEKGTHAASETIVPAIRDEGNDTLLNADGSASGGRKCGTRSQTTGPDGRPLPRDEEAAARVPVSAAEKAALERAAAYYEAYADKLKDRINAYFWDEELGAYIDGYESGKRNVTRHANILAIRYDFADAAQTESIVTHVLDNPEIPAITTPYFKYYELDVFGKLGRLDRLMEEIRSYWGGMLERGAVTVWEQFDPEEEGISQYGMYGDPFGKSLCHAWGASPIYLLGKYFPEIG